MRDLSSLRGALGFSVVGLVMSMAGVAGAQTPPPTAPPPATQAAPVAPAPVAPAPVAPAPVAPVPAPAPPPPGYAYPPPPPPGAYAYPQYAPPPSYRPPAAVPYEGGPIPPGYHLETRARRGLVIAGAVVTGVPWALGVTIAGGSDFPNHSGWLLLPAVGPWLTLLTRNESNCSSSSTTNDVCDSGVKTVLIMDGLMQTAGTVMFIAGLASPKVVVARDLVGSNLNLRFNPAPIGRQGYGAVISGTF